MSFLKPTRRQMSVHEASHAYAFSALVKSDYPRELCLTTDADGHSRGWCRRTTLLRSSSKHMAATEEARSRVEWNAAAEIIIAMAGPAAEFRVRHGTQVAAAIFIYDNLDFFIRPGAVDRDGDFERMRRSIACIETQDAAGTLHKLIQIAAEIVAMNWPSIRSLAQTLMTDGTMGDEQLSVWFENHPAKPWDASLTMDVHEGLSSRWRNAEPRTD